MDIKKNRDQKILGLIYAEFDQLKGSDRLSSKTIARYMDVKESAFSAGVLDDKRNFITLDRLIQLYNGLGEARNLNHKELQNVVLKIIQKDQIKRLNGMDTDKYTNELSHNNLAYFKTSAETVIFILSAQSNISIDLSDICSRSSKITILNLIISKDAVAQNIKAIEVWAYGKDGNYSGQLYLNIFQRDYEPIAEMVGGFIEGKFHAYIKDESYVAMSQIGHELLLEEENNLSNEQPVWSLPHSPEARIIERLRRELKTEDGFPVEALDFLANEAAAYEDTKPTSKDQDTNPWDALSDSLVSKMKCHKNKVIADESIAVEALLIRLRIVLDQVG